jgi:outer membrane protein OmpA-like peptidoglycan-associated protein
MRSFYYLIITFVLVSKIANAQARLICSVYFENGESQVSTKEKLKFLEAFAKFDSTRHYNLEIVAYADQVGNEKSNFLLASKRANFIKATLLKRLPNATILVKPIGEIGSAKLDSLKFYRRVDIFSSVVVKPKRNLAKDDIIIGERIVIEGILFVGSSSEFLPQSYESLDSLYTILNQRREYVVALYGHLNPYNEKGHRQFEPKEERTDIRTGLPNLSFSRAEAVLNYLNKKGIEKDRIVCLGMRSFYPISTKDINLNRRVEVVLKSVKIKDQSQEWVQLVERSKKERELVESAFNLKAIAALDSIYFRDQALRNEISSIDRTLPNNEERLKQLWEILDKSDAENLRVVEALIKKYGWLGRSSIGYRGEITLFLVIQHAPLATQKKYYGLMKLAVAKDEASAINLAYLEDRILVSEGRKQIYGTQLQFNAKTRKYELSPTIDEGRLNLRRAKLGLDPIEIYLKSFN